MDGDRCGCMMANDSRCLCVVLGVAVQMVRRQCVQARVRVGGDLGPQTWCAGDLNELHVFNLPTPTQPPPPPPPQVCAGDVRALCFAEEAAILTSATEPPGEGGCGEGKGGDRVAQSQQWQEEDTGGRRCITASSCGCSSSSSSTSCARLRHGRLHAPAGVHVPMHRWGGREASV